VSTVTTPPAVHVEAATVVHGTVQVLGPVTVTVPTGTSLVVAGTNGSGKSTLLALVAGTLLPRTGSVETLGRPAHETRVAARERLSVLTGGFGAYRELTVRDHFRLMSAGWRLGAQAGTSDDDDVDDLLDRTELASVGDQLPHELSSGESQMLSLVSACFRPSDLLLVDEPEQRLDARWRAQAVELLRDARASGRTLVVATHDPTFREALADVELVLEPRVR
jgi:ABC-2 type transport system ATP-binding protein